MNILSVKHLSKSFGNKKILDDVSFSLDAGKCLGIVGRSGCGKSTTVKIVARLLEADSGQIILDGEDITHKKNLRETYKKMQMIFQMPEDSFDPRQTLGWSIGEPMRNHHFDNIDEKIKNSVNKK